MKLCLSTIALLLLFVAASCGSGEDTDEATANCQRQRDAQSQCVDEAAFQQCVACREECGIECSQLESCPLQFVCN